MKIIYIIIIILICFSLEGRKKISEMDELIALTKKDSLCLERGHISLDSEVFIITRENVIPFVVDYPDSTAVYYYKNNIQKGTISRCIRCGKWIDMPRLELPLRYIMWQKTIKDSLEGK